MRFLFIEIGASRGMDIGFTLGANAPTAAFALHAAVATVFLYLGVIDAAAGELIGLVLNGLIAVMLAAAGVFVARITERRV
jgi:hypothetical protein